MLSDEKKDRCRWTSKTGEASQNAWAKRGESCLLGRRTSKYKGKEMAKKEKKKKRKEKKRNEETKVAVSIELAA